MKRLALFLAVTVSAFAAEEKTAPILPGAQPDGSVLLPNQWFLRPAGTQVQVGDFPVNIAVHPAGKFAAVLHCGYGQHEVQVLDVAAGKIVSRVNLAEAFYGCAFSPDGTRLIVSGSGDEVLWFFKFKDGYLSEPTNVRLRPKTARGIPGGFAVAKDGSTLYVANVWGQSVSRVRVVFGDDGQPTAAEVTDHIFSAPKGGGPAQPVGEKTDDPSITKRAEQILDTTGKDAPFPYTCVLDEARGRLYVSLWALKHVAVFDTATFSEIARWEVEEHPNEMLLARDGAQLLVANANRNTVSVLDTVTGRVVETLVAELFQAAPPGNTPNSLALSPNGELLFVANANINTVSVFEMEEPGKTRSLGFIPTGWYPTSVRHVGGKLIVANGKGVVSRANRDYPQPGEKSPPAGVSQYIAGIMQGTLSLLALPKEEDALEEQMKKWSAAAASCMPAAAKQIEAADLAGNPVPRKPGDPSPIKHVIYIVKENRTFDQVLGDLGRGNGDPSLCLFPEPITPNHHALARDFVTLDNFYVESEVSADGHEWSMGGIATDWVEKNWPLSYGHNGSKKFPYPSEGAFPAAAPAGGYLWDRAKAAGVTYRSYGEFTTNPAPGKPAKAKVPGLEGHIDPEYSSFDMDYPDMKRADRFISELQRFEKEGDMPRLQIVRLPCDHTSGASPGKPTPIAHMADNDFAFGRIVEALSRSKFWATTAIFVVEDDAQNGPDHVDAHRTIAYVISPYVRRASVDSTLYSTASMLRTMELILGLAPMTQFDALAMPMFACFQKEPDLRPYTALTPKADMTEKVKKTAWGVKETLNMDLTKEDAADDLLLNEIIWRNVRGATAVMPAPVRRAWVIGEGDED